jgi:uncharacterized protein
MKANMYSMTVPVFMRSLTNLANILEKAEHHATEAKYDLNHLLQDRLYRDMFPFVRQVQIACDTAKGAGARLAGIDVPAFPDDEKTSHELIARIRKTVEYFPGKVFDGFTYATEYALPNFFFHVTIAYALLRHNGVPLGKMDYLGSLTLRDKSA